MHWRQDMSHPENQPTPTRWPTFRALAFGPTAVMRPTTSCPSTAGNREMPHSLLKTETSEWQMPQCSTAISISSSPSGPGLMSSSTSGSFADRATQVWLVIAFAPPDGLVCVNVDMEHSFRGSMLAVLEKLLAGDLVVLHRVAGDFLP